VLQARGRLTDEEARVVIQDAQREWEDGRLVYSFGIAYARKPG